MQTGKATAMTSSSPPGQGPIKGAGEEVWDPCFEPSLSAAWGH